MVRSAFLRELLYKIRRKEVSSGIQPGYLYKIFDLVPLLTNLAVCATERFKKVKVHTLCDVRTFFTPSRNIIFFRFKRTNVSQFERIVDEGIVEVLDEIYANKI
jgi:hypothetical protein